MAAIGKSSTTSTYVGGIGKKIEEAQEEIKKTPAKEGAKKVGKILQQMMDDKIQEEGKSRGRGMS